jgi:hypothetical protein
MKGTLPRRDAALRGIVVALGVLLAGSAGLLARSPNSPDALPVAKALPVKQSSGIDDSLRRYPAADLSLDPAGIRKAEALATLSKERGWRKRRTRRRADRLPEGAHRSSRRSGARIARRFAPHPPGGFPRARSTF